MKIHYTNTAKSSGIRSLNLSYVIDEGWTSSFLSMNYPWICLSPVVDVSNGILFEIAEPNYNHYEDFMKPAFIKNIK